MSMKNDYNTYIIIFTRVQGEIYISKDKSSALSRGMTSEDRCNILTKRIRDLSKDPKLEYMYVCIGTVAEKWKESNILVSLFFLTGTKDSS